MSLISDACEKTNRTFHSKIEITWTDPYIDNTIAVSANDENYCHSVYNTIQHAADLIEDVPFKYFHLDGVSNLGGSFHVFPGTELTAAEYKTGWWSAVPGDSGGEWVTTPVLTVTFAKRSIFGLNVVGDNKYYEYPVSFDIKVYTLITDTIPVYTDSVVDSVGAGWVLSNVLPSDTSSVKWFKTLDTVIGEAEKIELHITKWNVGSRIVKISEFYTDVVEIYTDDDIKLIRLTEETELSEGTLPIGNISSNELDIRLENITNRFFVGNTNSPIYTLLKQNRRLRAWVGVEVVGGSTEWTLLGTFFSGDWQARELDTTAGTSARDRMELLRRSDFEISDLYEDITLYDLVEIVLNDAKLKITDLRYVISANLNDYVVKYAWFEKVSYFECIKKIVGACQGRAYMSRDDILQIETDL